LHPEAALSQEEIMAAKKIALPRKSKVENDSEDESTSDSEEGDDEEEEQFPLPAARPTDPEKVVEYDVVKIVWAKRTAHLTAESIRSAMGDYWNIVKGIRDTWKAEFVAVQEAEKAGDKSRVERGKRRLEESRDTLERVVRVTTLHGHRDIVERYVSSPFISPSFFFFFSFFPALFPPCL
jgi:hypothetical protein